MSDDRQPPSHPGFRHAGTGMATVRSCLGCGGRKGQLGSSGYGLKWRCAACTEARAAKKAAEAAAR